MPASAREPPTRSDRNSFTSRPSTPRVFRYVVKHTGFAPCFNNGICTLACCKPSVRRSAVVGDWILGFAPRSKGDARLVYAIRVGEVLDFRSYAQDPRFGQRLDNIYQPDGGGRYCRVAARDIHASPREQERDLSGRHVLIADQWWYFQDEGRDLRFELGEEIAYRLWYSGRGHKVSGLRPGDLEALLAILGHAGGTSNAMRSTVECGSKSQLRGQCRD